MSKNSINIGLKAFEYFSLGWSTGDFSKYFDLLDDDFIFYFPEGKHAGKYYGLEAKNHMIEKCLDHSVNNERLTLDSPYKMTANENSVVFEFTAHGILNGKSYQGDIAISFDIREEKISGFREYYGFEK